MPSIAHESLSPGQTLLSRFLLLAPLGRGGMGEVWKAQDKVMEIPVALKFVSGEFCQDAAALLLLKREAQKARTLTHPGIVRVHDFHEGDGVAFLSMEFVDGITLADLADRQRDGIFEPGEIGDLVVQLCQALDYAHQQVGLIHRDLKPANLMIDRQQRLRVMDFGIAAPQPSAGAAFTRSLAASGTLPYMSPQQLQGVPPVPKDDIYSLGATLYELLTGRPPFYTGDIPHDVLYKVPPSVRERREELGLIRPPVAGNWESVINLCLSKDPARRPNTAGVVAQRLGLAASAGVAAAPAAATPIARVTARESSPGSAVAATGSAPVESRSTSVRTWLIGAFLVVALVARIARPSAEGDRERDAVTSPPPVPVESEPVSRSDLVRPDPASVAPVPPPAATPLPPHLAIDENVQRVYDLNAQTLLLVNLLGGTATTLDLRSATMPTTLVLRSEPVVESFSAAQQTLYLAYGDGGITRVIFGGATPPVESEFVRHPVKPVMILATTTGLLVADKRGAWGTLSAYASNRSRLVSSREWFQPPTFAAWNASLHRAYFLAYGVSPRDLHFEDIDSTLKVGTKGDSPYHDSAGMVGPIFVLERSVLLASGRMFAPQSLQQTADLSFPVAGAAEVGGKLFVIQGAVDPWGNLIAPAGDQTTVHRVNARGSIEETLHLPGRFVASVAWGRWFAVVVDLREKTRIFLLNEQLVVVDAEQSTPDDAAVSLGVRPAPGPGRRSNVTSHRAPPVVVDAARD